MANLYKKNVYLFLYLIFNKVYNRLRSLRFFIYVAYLFFNIRLGESAD